MYGRIKKEYKEDIKRIYKFNEISIIRDQLLEYYSTNEFTSALLTYRYRRLQFERDNLIPYTVAILTGLILFIPTTIIGKIFFSESSQSESNRPKFNLIFFDFLEKYNLNFIVIIFALMLLVLVLFLLLFFVFFVPISYFCCLKYSYTDTDVFVHPYEIKLIKEKLRQKGFDVDPDPTNDLKSLNADDKHNTIAADKELLDAITAMIDAKFDEYEKRIGRGTGID